MTHTIRITGKRAVEYAEAHGVPIERGGARVERYPSEWRDTLESDQVWDAPADDGEQVYVEVPAPYAVVRYVYAEGSRVADIDYFESHEDAQTAFGQADVPAGSASRVELAIVDEDGEPMRTLAVKRARTEPRRRS